jgi:hypothetical protein
MENCGLDQYALLCKSPVNMQILIGQVSVSIS